MQKPKDIEGQRFGRLLDLTRLAEKDSRGSFIWVFACDCGKSVKRPISSVTSGDTKSCGCLQKEVQEAMRKKK